MPYMQKCIYIYKLSLKEKVSGIPLIANISFVTTCYDAAFIVGHEKLNNIKAELNGKVAARISAIFQPIP